MGNVEAMCLSNDADAKDVINKPKSVFSECPHMMWDNSFSGDCPFNCTATEGFGLTMTC